MSEFSEHANVLMCFSWCELNLTHFIQLILSGCFWGLWASFVTIDGFSVRATKSTSRISVSWTHSLPLCFWCIFNSMNYDYIIILSKVCKPDNFESRNSLKLIFMSICDLQISFNVDLSWNQTLLTFLLYGRQTWITQLILAISLWQIIFLQSKRILWFICIVHVNGGLPFAWDLCLENLQILNHVFDWLYYTQGLTSFSSVNHLSWLYAWFFILFHLTLMGLSQSTHLPMCLVDFNVNHKDWVQPVLVELIDFYNFYVFYNSYILDFYRFS